MDHEPHPRIAERTGPHLTTHERGPGFNSRLALLITKGFGSMWAFYLLVGWMFVWMALATAGIGWLKEDRYPFAFLLFLSNLIQLWALPVIMVGQHVLSEASDKQALQTFKDTEAVLHLTDEVHRLIKVNNALTEEIHASLAKPRQIA